MRPIIVICLFGLVSGCEGDVAQTEEMEETPFVVRCTEPLPEFTLGIDSNPSELEVTVLCGCIWEELGDWERRTSQALTEGRDSKVSAMHKRGFPSRFGSVVKQCGGMDM